MARIRRRLSDESGTALVLALMAMMLLTALAATVVMVSDTEVKIAGNYNNGQEALYAADAAVERVMQDLLMIPRWDDVLSGSVKSSFTDGDAAGEKTLLGGGSITLWSASETTPPSTATGQLQSDTNTANLWGANNPQWQLFAWGALSSMLDTVEIDSAMYVAVWIADDPAENDGNPAADTNGTLTLHAEAYGPGGARKVLEVTVARSSSTEIERGQIAQRGQEELNQRARKAAVQTPGSSLSNMRLNTGTGGLAVQ